MTPSPTPSPDALEQIRALLDRADSDDPRPTLLDIAEVWGVHEDTARKRLRKLRRAGKVKMARVPRMDGNGQLNHTTVYEVVDGGD